LEVVEPQRTKQLGRNRYRCGDNIKIIIEGIDCGGVD
jgi:hypothetical protein